jgi:hypothetical protein
MMSGELGPRGRGLTRGHSVVVSETLLQMKRADYEYLWVGIVSHREACRRRPVVPPICTKRMSFCVYSYADRTRQGRCHGDDVLAYA